MAEGLGLDAWWEEPRYQACNTLYLRGQFIFDKLREHAAGKFEAVMADLYGTSDPTRRTSASSSGRRSSPTWEPVPRRSPTSSTGWGGCGGDGPSRAAQAAPVHEGAPA